MFVRADFDESLAESMGHRKTQTDCRMHSWLRHWVISGKGCHLCSQHINAQFFKKASMAIKDGVPFYPQVFHLSGSNSFDMTYNKIQNKF